jgi:dTDP-4-dehydrorhamnose reductase
MRILLLGKNGQLGWELHRTLSPLGEVVALDFPEIDLSSPEDIRPRVYDLKPQVIVNAAAYTTVDRAETEPGISQAVNGLAPGILAELASKLGAALIHYSTDYVFDGAKGFPYVETDAPNPLNVYGRSKLAGEQAVRQVNGSYLILRTSWVYSLRCESFVTKVLQWARQHQTLHIVEDQVGSPTWSRMLAEVTAQLLVNALGSGNPAAWIGARKGIYHLAGDGAASRLQWARAILRLDPDPTKQIAQEVLPASTADFHTPAVRPLYSALNCERFKNTFGLRLPDWATCLQLAMQNSDDKIDL